jgi:hypothetical protein
MPDTATRRRVLDPLERTSEVLFGLIMALTFTGSLSVASAGRSEVRDMLIGAVGCNLAWGLVDAVMYLLSTLVERGRNLNLYRRVRAATEPAEVRQALADAMPSVVAAAIGDAGLDRLHGTLVGLPEPPARARLRRDNFAGALGVFLLVVLSTLPVVVPFLLMADAHAALRVSNGIAIALLFACGWRMGHYTGGRPLRWGLVMVVVGAALVALTLVLGG